MRGEYEDALKFGIKAMDAGLPLEHHMPFIFVPILGSLGMVYLDISEKFTEKIAEFHLHALQLLESPVTKIAGGTAWADLGFCALELGDLKIAETVFQQGLDYPNIFMRLERPRHLAGAAWLASLHGDSENATKLVQEAIGYAEERKMSHILPFILLVKGRISFANSDYSNSETELQQARRSAQALGQRSIEWKACTGAAQALEAGGFLEAAEAQRTDARMIIDEIAGKFRDPELREAYLLSAQRKIRSARFA
jgi:hypothetical protein